MSAVFSDDFKAWLRDTALRAWELIKTAAVWVWSRYARELVCFGIGLLAGLLIMSAHTDKAIDKVSAQYEAEIAEMTAVKEQTEAEKATEGQKISLYRDVARALYGVRDYGLSSEAKKAYIQVMLNRANPEIQYDVMRGTDDLQSVLAVPNQWQAYRPDGNYTEEDFQLVKEFLESGNGNFLNSDKYYWCEIKPGYIICKADINGKTSIPDQVVQ
ncbi:MAG: hypothetical protein IIZ78_13195 [Clostridiales bacterium]|nr:hypothetical protein [Clostridiales bacterium]